MTDPSFNKVPSNVNSSADGRVLAIEIARRRLAALGVYTKSGLALLVYNLGIVFVVAIDVEVSGQIGRFFFEPLPGEPDNGLFGQKTILATTLLSALVLHLAAQGKEQVPVLRLIDAWAPRFALVYIGGASLLLMATMSGAINPEVYSEWGDGEVPVLSGLIAHFSAGVLNPLAQLAFALGFGTVLIGTIFALSKLFEGWMKAIAQILDKATQSSAMAQAAQDIKTCRIEYRQKAAQYNAAVARREAEEQIAIASMLYQIAARVLAELRAQAHKRPDTQFPSYRSTAGEINCAEIDALALSCTFEVILAAIRADDAQAPSTNPDTPTPETSS